MANDRNAKAYANPTKKFFVNMITRDISLEDSILDLIDNSVDSACHTTGGKPMRLDDSTDLSMYSISIDFSPEQFSIKDNCGGMSLDDAVNHAFSFGRRDSEEHDEYSIGVYGIGMKRAVFKIGREISIRSTPSADTDDPQPFAVPINVDRWLENDAPPWDFGIEEDEGLDENEVEIVVKNLTPAARTSFDNPAFIQSLRRMIARDYWLYLDRGLKISIQAQAVHGSRIALRRSDEFVPVRVEYEDQQNGETVSVEIVGGMAAPPPESIEPDDKGDGDRRFGWYVACNGRIVLAADKSSVSGWGTRTLDWPQWHRQYSGFLGIVLFSASNAEALPLTTTKRSVDVTSEIFYVHDLECTEFPDSGSTIRILGSRSLKRRRRRKREQGLLRYGS